MTAPSYIAPRSSEEAVALLLAEPGAAPMGGGTDLLALLEEGVVRPSTLVDLREIPGAVAITAAPDGGTRIGSAVAISQLADDPLIRDGYRALAEACDAVGTPALRNMGTLGGNLCQRPRCWYFRRNIACLKNGGDGCPAKEGENQYHAILGGGPCYMVHPSDPAVALMALDATIHISGPGGDRALPIARFFRPPSERMDAETDLRPGEFVAAVTLPAEARGGTQRYVKLMQRGAWDFALVSLATAKRRDGDVRLVLGGVAPVPWRVSESVEEDVASGGLDEQDIATLADRALYDAEALSGNGYKLDMAATLLRRGIADLLA